jgi:SAM-dependent MidA family methyltransferase
MSALPIPSQALLAYSQQLSDLVQQQIKKSGGWISFADFMHMALYTPELGYYSGGLQKFGDLKQGGGDFVTAPEISPLFSQALAKQVDQVLKATQGDVLELGAGTGKLAVDLLLALNQLGQLPNHYYILEVSSHLRSVQRENLQKVLPKSIFNRMHWLDELPQQFTGCILGNEVLDAIPVHLVIKQEGKMMERGVTFDSEFKWQDQDLMTDLVGDAFDIETIPEGYLTEVCPGSVGLINSLANVLNYGALLMIDYGFGATEYYHPQRNQGTLMCHYQHYAHSDPFQYIGLQDITAHVDFTAIAEAATSQGLILEGYTNQAQFLMNCGILDLLSQQTADETKYAAFAAGVQKLLSPAEMGELFKVIAFSKGIEETMLGFVKGDKTHTL